MRKFDDMDALYEAFERLETDYGIELELMETGDDDGVQLCFCSGLYRHSDGSIHDCPEE